MIIKLLVKRYLLFIWVLEVTADKDEISKSESIKSNAIIYVLYDGYIRFTWLLTLFMDWLLLNIKKI